MVTLISSFSLLTPFFLGSQFWSCLGLQGRIFLKGLRIKVYGWWSGRVGLECDQVTARCLVLGLATLLNMEEATAVWPQGLLDACFAMIPKVDGGSTPLGQRPLDVLPVFPSVVDLPHAHSSQG